MNLELSLHTVVFISNALWCTLMYSLFDMVLFNTFCNTTQSASWPSIHDPWFKVALNCPIIVSEEELLWNHLLSNTLISVSLLLCLLIFHTFHYDHISSTPCIHTERCGYFYSYQRQFMYSAICIAKYFRGACIVFGRLLYSTCQRTIAVRTHVEATMIDLVAFLCIVAWLSSK